MYPSIKRNIYIYQVKSTEFHNLNKEKCLDVLF